MLSLPQTYSANEALPKRRPLEEINASFIFYLPASRPCVGLLVPSPAPTHLMFPPLLSFFPSLPTPTVTHNVMSISSCTLQSPLTPAALSSRPGYPHPPTEDPPGAALGVGPDQRTQRRRRLRDQTVIFLK